MFMRSIAAVLMCLAAPADASSHYHRLLAANPAADDMSCTFKRTSSSDNGTRVEAFDGGWHLLSVDGEAPAAKQLAEYAEMAPERAERKHPLALNIEKLLEPDTLELSRTTADGQEFIFSLLPESEDDKAIFPHVTARLLTAPDYRVREMRVKNHEDFSPQTGVKLKRFEQSMSFGWDETLGHAVIEQVKVMISGKAFFFKEISQNEVVRFSDIQCSPVL